MCVKNCGHHFHVEVAAKDFLDTVVGFTRVQVRAWECCAGLDACRATALTPSCCLYVLQRHAVWHER